MRGGIPQGGGLRQAPLGRIIHSPAALDWTAPMGRRLAYIDWLRGIAVLLMIQVHAYNAWLSPWARQSRTWETSRTLGGYAAPLFLFLAGIGLGLLLEGRRTRGAQSRDVVREGLHRGAEVLVYAFAFRLWMLATGGFRSPQTFL